MNNEHTELPADYVHQFVHLAYASTVHGVQGQTATHSDMLLTDTTDAAAAYVGMTRGRHTNTVHIVADTEDQARQQWVEAAGRNCADLGLENARAAALGEARNYRETPSEAVQQERPRASMSPYDRSRLTAAVTANAAPPGRRRALGAGRRSFGEHMHDIEAAIEQREENSETPAPSVHDDRMNSVDDVEHQANQHRVHGPRI